MLSRRTVLPWLTVAALLPILPVSVTATGEKPSVRYPWLADWIKNDGLDPAWIDRLLAPLTVNKRVIRLMDNQAESKPYYQYRKIFINENRIQRGLNRVKRYRWILRRVYRKYRVPPEIILALWGLESNYGRQTGGFSVLRTLYTLAAHYPRRGEFFQRQLRAFFLLCRDEGWDPRVPLGSYAGAMGQPQMIPETMRRYAVDFNGDGKRDIFHNTGDVLASIAAFLKENGWKPGGPYALAVTAGDGLAERLSPSLSRMRPWREWHESGIRISDAGPQPGEEEPAALIMLEEKRGPRYYMVFGNFWVITRWNRSTRFAMVVRELADHLRKMS